MHRPQWTGRDPKVPDLNESSLEGVPPTRLGILDHRRTALVDLGPAGGSNGSRIAVDGEGRRWMVKHYGGDRDRVATELLANAIYREMGLATPQAGVGLLAGDGRPDQIAATYPMLEGEHRVWNEPSEALAEGFVVDALLANRDVIGLDRDNILWRGAIPIRIDQGGTFEFRAMGQRKVYGPEPVELETMLEPYGQARDTMAVTPDLIEDGAASVVAILNPERVGELLSQAPFEDEEMRERIHLNLVSRIEWLGGIR